MTRKILVVDDHRNIGEFVVAAGEILGWECIQTTNANDFLDNLASNPNLIFLDLMMPDMDGIELLRLLAQKHCDTGIVLMSGIGKRVMDTADELAKTLGLFIVGHLRKPFQFKELEAILTRPHIRARSTLPHAMDQFIISDTDLQRAIQRNEFVNYYQPQIEITTGRVVGLEALVRWIHPDRGLIFPDEFIARLEATGAIDELGWIVANRAFADLGQFADETGITPTISLNASVQSLLDLKFPDTLLSLAEKFSVSPHKITIEITETGLIEELSKTLDVLTRLRMNNIQVAIDDFGTGYSMMQQLRYIPATELKIDRSFIRDMHFNEEDRIIVQKTIEIGHELGMRVVVEGVEIAEQLELMRRNGCDIAQGYLFTRPLPPPALVSWLKEYPSLCAA